MEISVKNVNGEVVSKIEVDESIFGVQPNESVVHQALVRHWANRRAGTASAKSRGEVAGSTRKLYRQKHTGFARAGGRRSPTRRGGGAAFGPTPRSYRQAMPKKMRRLAIKSVLSSKVADGELTVIDSFGIENPGTRQMVNILKALDMHMPVLLVTSEPEMNIVRSARNIEKTKIVAAGLINVVDLLSHKSLLMTVDAIQRIESIWGSKPAPAAVEG